MVTLQSCIRNTKNYYRKLFKKIIFKNKKTKNPGLAPLTISGLKFSRYILKKKIKVNKQEKK